MTPQAFVWLGQPDANDVARVVSVAFFADIWPAAVHVGNCEIAPVATFLSRATEDGVAFADPVQVGTIKKPGDLYYGGVVGVGTGNLPPLLGFTPAKGAVNVSDVQALILTFQGDSSPSVPVTWVDLYRLGTGSPQNFILSISDLQRIQFGLSGQLYTDEPNQIDPADCP